jgi:hypothetical protein
MVVVGGHEGVGAESPRVPDGAGPSQAGGDACEQAVGLGAGAVVFEVELVFFGDTAFTEPGSVRHQGTGIPARNP